MILFLCIHNLIHIFFHFCVFAVRSLCRTSCCKDSVKQIPHLIQFLSSGSVHVQAVLKSHVNFLLELLHLLRLCQPRPIWTKQSRGFKLWECVSFYSCVQVWPWHIFLFPRAHKPSLINLCFRKLVADMRARVSPGASRTAALNKAISSSLSWRRLRLLANSKTAFTRSSHPTNIQYTCWLPCWRWRNKLHFRWGP